VTQTIVSASISLIKLNQRRQDCLRHHVLEEEFKPAVVIP